MKSTLLSKKKTERKTLILSKMRGAVGRVETYFTIEERRNRALVQARNWSLGSDERHSDAEIMC